MIFPRSIGRMEPHERNFVLSSWQLNYRSVPRMLMERCVSHGTVWVARNDDLALGWLCESRGQLAYAYTRRSYQHDGIMRELWERAGCPMELMRPYSERTYNVFRRLIRAHKESA